MKTFYQFKCVSEFRHFLRTKKWKEGELDYITIGKKIFTMHEYDMDGRYTSWANKKYNLIIDCETANRYKSWQDATLVKYHPYGLRSDISYAQ